MGKQKSPPHSAEDEFTPWYHLNLPHSRGLIRSPQTVRAISGAPRLRLLQISAKPLRKVFGAVLLAALHQTAVLWKKDDCAYWFSSSRLFWWLYHFLRKKSITNHSLNAKNQSFCAATAYICSAPQNKLSLFSPFCINQSWNLYPFLCTLVIDFHFLKC